MSGRGEGPVPTEKKKKNKKKLLDHDYLAEQLPNHLLNVYLESLKESRGKGQNNYFFNNTIFFKFNENKKHTDIEISTNVNTSNTKKTTSKCLIIKISEKEIFEGVREKWHIMCKETNGKTTDFWLESVQARKQERKEINY